MATKRTPVPEQQETTLETEYVNIFVSIPAPAWKQDDQNYSLEQPSFLKWVPSETTYGIDFLLESAPPNAQLE